MEYNDSNASNPDLYISSGKIQSLSKAPSDATLLLNGTRYKIDPADLDKFAKSGTQVINIIPPDFNKPLINNPEVRKYIDANINTESVGMIMVFPMGKIAYEKDSTISYDYYGDYAPGITLTYTPGTEIIYDEKTGYADNLNRIFSVYKQYNTTKIYINGELFLVTDKIPLVSTPKINFNVSDPQALCDKIKANVSTVTQRLSSRNTKVAMKYAGEPIYVEYYKNTYILYCDKNQATTYIDTSSNEYTLTYTTNKGLDAGTYLLFNKNDIDNIIADDRANRNISIVLASDAGRKFYKTTNISTLERPPICYINPIRAINIDDKKSASYPHLYFGGIDETKISVSLEELRKQQCVIGETDYYVYKMPMYDVAYETYKILCSYNTKKFDELKKNASSSDMMQNISVPYDSDEQAIVVFEDATGRVLFIEDFSTSGGKRGLGFFGKYYPITMLPAVGKLILPSDQLISVTLTNVLKTKTSLIVDMSVSYYCNGHKNNVDKKAVELYSQAHSMVLDEAQGVTLSWQRLTRWDDSAPSHTFYIEDWEDQFDVIQRLNSGISINFVLTSKNIPTYSTSSSDINNKNINKQTDSYLMRVESNVV